MTTRSLLLVAAGTLACGAPPAAPPPPEPSATPVTCPPVGRVAFALGNLYRPAGGPLAPTIYDFHASVHVGDLVQLFAIDGSTSQIVRVSAVTEDDEGNTRITLSTFEASGWISAGGPTSVPIVALSPPPSCTHFVTPPTLPLPPDGRATRTVAIDLDGDGSADLALVQYEIPNEQDQVECETGLRHDAAGWRASWDECGD